MGFLLFPDSPQLHRTPGLEENTANIPNNMSTREIVSPVRLVELKVSISSALVITPHGKEEYLHLLILEEVTWKVLKQLQLYFETTF